MRESFFLRNCTLLILKVQVLTVFIVAGVFNYTFFGKMMNINFFMKFFLAISYFPCKSSKPSVWIVCITSGVFIILGRYANFVEARSRQESCSPIRHTKFRQSSKPQRIDWNELLKSILSCSELQ